MTHSNDAAAWVEEARDVSVMAAVDRRGIKLSKGVERVGPCPVCGGRDRFSVNTRKDVWHCRGSGRGGDAIALIEYLDGADFLAACETLTGRPPPRGEGTRLSPEDLARREAERRAREAEREEEAAGYRERERRHLWKMWEAAARSACAPMLAGYFERRGLDLPRPCKALRFLANAPYFHGEEEDDRARMRPRLIYRGPAMLAAITDAAGRFQGLHCTWLDLSRPKGKAEIFDPDTGEELPAKKVRGSKRGHRILLVPAAGDAPTRQISGEGIETVMAVRSGLLRAGGLDPDCEFVSAVDLGNLAGRSASSVPHPTITVTDTLGRVRARRVPGPVSDMASEAMWVPDSIVHLTLLGDGDSDPFTTRCAMERATARHAAPGRWVSTAWAPEGQDFNDVLLGRHLPAAAGRVAA